MIVVRYRAVRKPATAAGAPTLPYAQPARVAAPHDVGYEASIDELRASPAMAKAPFHVRNIAVDLILQAGLASWDSNHRRLRLLAGTLMHDEHLHGQLDAARALTRDSIEAYLGTLEPHYAQTTIATYTSDLRHFSRALYPQAYPNALRQREGKGPMPLRHSPCSREEIERLWRDVERVGESLSVNARVVFAAAAGAGARAQEIARLHGRDVLTVDQDGRRVTCLDLTCLSRDERRIVPVLEEPFAAFLREVADRRGPDARLLGYAAGRSGGTGYTFDRIRVCGIKTNLNAVRMRHYFVLRLVMSAVPTAAVMHVADINDSHLLARLQVFMPAYATRDLIDVVRRGVAS